MGPDYGRAIRVARAKSGVSQKELAWLCGLRPSYVSMLERGVRTSPSSAVIDGICMALSVPAVVLAALASSPAERALSGDEASEAVARAFLSWIFSP